MASTIIEPSADPVVPLAAEWMRQLGRIEVMTGEEFDSSPELMEQLLELEDQIIDTKPDTTVGWAAKTWIIWFRENPV